MVRLAAEYPHRILVCDRVLCRREGAVGVVIRHRNTGKRMSISPAEAGWGTYNPESKPPSASWQGLSRDDCDTVWFFCLKEKTMVSPALAF